MTANRPARIISLILRYLVPLAVTVGLCYMLFRDIDIAEMWADMRACDYRWIALGFIPATAACVFRALRWRIQLHAAGITPPLRVLIYSFFGTYAVNIVFPRLGEVWRTGYIAQRQRAPFTVVFGSMVADRLADTATVLIMTLLTAALAGDQIAAFVRRYPVFYDMMSAILTSPWTYIAAIAIAAMLWWLMRRRPARGIPGRIHSIIRGLWDGFAALAHMRGKTQWLLWTLMVWACYFLQCWLAFYSSPLTRQVLADHGITAVIVCYVLTTISMGVPSNGGIGPYQTVMRFGLSLYVATTMGAAGAAAAGAAGAASAAAGSVMTAAQFDLQSLSFANLLLGSNTLLFIVLGLLTFAAIALDNRRRQP